MTAQPKSSRSANNKLLLVLLAALFGAALTFFISYRIYGGANEVIGLDVWIANMTAQPDFQNVLLVNVLVGVSVALFIMELRGAALRVTITVIAALIFGFLMTFVFNLDTANRLIRGDFRVALISDAEPIENDAVDLEYGRGRADTFNEPNVRLPVTEAVYTFEGRSGDVVTILAYASSRRSDVNLQTALIAPDGSIVAEANSATEAQLVAYEEDLQDADDAVIENITLTADGVYSIRTVPEAIPTGTIFSEAFSATSAAYDAFLLGALGRVNRWAVWIQDALTLILVGLSIAIVFRARQFSLGAEGQLYFGALVSGLVVLAGGTLPGWLLIPVAILSAMTAGFLWGLIPGVLKAYLNANELVSTLMLNAVAVQFYELVLTFQLQPPDVGFTRSEDFSASGILPVIVNGTQVTIAVFFVIIAVIAVWLLITRTPLGYEIRTVGNNLKFANYGGINTRRTIMLAMAVSGILAGLGGAHLSMGIHRMLILNISFGLAFEGVVVALLARNNPLVIPFAGLLYAYLRAGAQFMERDANISFEVVRIIQAVIILLITAEGLLAFMQSRRNRVVPAGPGTPSTTMESPRLIVEAATEEKANV